MILSIRFDNEASNELILDNRATIDRMNYIFLFLLSIFNQLDCLHPSFLTLTLNNRLEGNQLVQSCD